MRSKHCPSRVRAGLVAFVAIGMIACACAAQAQTLNVVALGASNTEGRGRGATNMGVPRNQAYPAQLERILRAQGVDARVRNAGVAGDTTAGMLARLNSAVPAGTHVVILQPGGNDARRGGSDAQRAANIGEITRRLQARNIPVLVLDRFGQGIGQHRLADGQHFNAAGHAAVAASLAPRVLAAGRGR
jgi:acyl-CoA thioesterase-1